MVAYNYRLLRDGPEPDYDWMDSLYQRFLAVQIFGTKQSRDSAEAAMTMLGKYVESGDLDHSILKHSKIMFAKI